MFAETPLTAALKAQETIEIIDRLSYAIQNTGLQIFMKA